MQSKFNEDIVVMGIGYVVMPSSVGFATKYDVFGSDINEAILSKFKFNKVFKPIKKVWLSE